MWLKKKYRTAPPTVRKHGDYLVDSGPAPRNGGEYRGRTGPVCCHPNCGRRRTLWRKGTGTGGIKEGAR